MKSYETSAATLRAILAHPSLERTHVDATIDALASANADAREIDEAIRIGADSATGAADIDEDEIAAELAALADEAGREKEAIEATREEQRAPQTPTREKSQDERARAEDMRRQRVAEAA